jgi:hypothetical protein
MRFHAVTHHCLEELAVYQGDRPGRKLSAQDAAKSQAWSDRAPGRPLLLPQAVRPAGALDWPLREGYRVEVYKDAGLGLRMPVMTVALSADKLFPVFVDLLAPLGDVVDFIVESSHDLAPAAEGDSPVPSTWERTGIDLPVLCSILYDFEDLLLNDGCTGVAVLAPSREYEVHFDEHKLLYLYGPSLARFEAILQKHKITRDDDLILLTESEHIHSTLDEYYDRLNDLCQTVGVEGEVGLASW